MKRLGLALALLAAAACGGHPSDSDCARAADHMIDIFAAPKVPGGSVPTDLAQASEAWKKGLQAFYADHAGFVAETLHVSLPAAREYAAEHGLALANQGIAVVESWDVVPHELAAWALEGERAA